MQDPYLLVKSEVEGCLKRAFASKERVENGDRAALGVMDGALASAGETLQAVISGSADIGIGIGTAGAMRAFARGAPVRVLAAGRFRLSRAPFPASSESSKSGRKKED